MSTLITPVELAQWQSDGESLFIFDCRSSLMDEAAGKRAYDDAHIPGAQFAHLSDDLSGPITTGVTGRHPLPEKDAFVTTLEKWGVTNHSRIVAYDDANGAFAARLWWMMRWVGHANVAVLEGGLMAWKAAGFATDAAIPQPVSSKFTPTSSISKTIDADDLLNSGHFIIDARDQERFDGKVEPIDPIAGHIPGAHCLPFMQNLTDTMNFKSTHELQARFADAGMISSTQTACYCGSGVTAAHNILALVHAGYPEPILYPGSWSEWITDASRPVATHLSAK